MKLKKLCAALLSATMVLGLVACGGEKNEDTATKAPATEEGKNDEATSEPEEKADDTSSDEAVTLVYAEVNPEDSLMGKTAAKFKEEVEKNTNGTVTVDVQYGGVLGAEGDVLDSMIGGTGTVDVSRISTASLTSYGVKLTTLLSVPYLIESREHFWNLADSELGSKILAEPSELGLSVHGMFYVEEGFRHFFFKDEVKGLSDLKDKKIRVSTDPVAMGMVKGLGGSPTEIAFTELYSSLSSGVVDAAEQPIANYKSNAFNEVAPYMILDGHTLGAGEVIISDGTWDKLSEDQQKAVTEAGKVASEFNAGLSEENEETCKKDLIEAGVKFIDVADIKEWQDACADIAKTTIGDMTAEADEIRGMK